jgi:hypothetical protein
VLREGSAVTLALIASGTFFLVGLLTGVWKFRATATSEEHRAPLYVNIAHQASLLYSFAALVIARLLERSSLSSSVQLVATALPLVFFGVSIATYVSLGIKKVTRTQYARRTFVTTWGTYALIAGEVGGFVVILYGFLKSAIEVGP